MIDEDEDFESTDGDAAQRTTYADRRYAGVRALWMKVIVRAVFDFHTYKNHTKVDKRKYAESAYAWLFEKNLLFNSFENVCNTLGLDPLKLRARILSMTKEDVAKVEHMERDYETDVVHEIEEVEEQPDFYEYSTTVVRRRRLAASSVREIHGAL